MPSLTSASFHQPSNRLDYPKRNRYLLTPIRNPTPILIKPQPLLTLHPNPDFGNY